jgi:hypothetical protein
VSDLLKSKGQASSQMRQPCAWFEGSKSKATADDVIHEVTISSLEFPRLDE